MFTDDGWDPGDMMDGSYGSSGMMDGSGFVMMLLVALLLAALVATTVYFALRASDSGRRAPSPSIEPPVGSPRDLLDQRLARGEISSEDYRTTRTLLES